MASLHRCLCSTLSRTRFSQQSQVYFKTHRQSSTSTTPSTTASAATTLPPQEPFHPTSSVAAGTPLKGLGIYKGKGDPVALEDSAYPDWVWTLTQPDLGVGSEDDPIQAMKRQLNRDNAKQIRANNFLRNKKK